MPWGLHLRNRDIKEQETGVDMVSKLAADRQLRQGGQLDAAVSVSFLHRLCSCDSGVEN